METLRTYYDSAKQDRLKFQNELAHKVAECKALALECERVKEDSDEQIKQLEDALKDVQKRMYESEGKVKQMQTHFLALLTPFTQCAPQPQIHCILAWNLASLGLARPPLDWPWAFSSKQTRELHLSFW